MPFLDKQKFGKITGAGKEKTAPAKKEEPKDPSGFGGKPYLKLEELQRWARRPELYTQTGGTPEKARLRIMEEDLRPHGPYLEKNKREPEEILRKLKEKRFQAKTGAEQAEIDKRIKLWNKFLGK